MRGRKQLVRSDNLRAGRQDFGGERLRHPLAVDRHEDLMPRIVLVHSREERGTKRCLAKTRLRLEKVWDDRRHDRLCGECPRFGQFLCERFRRPQDIRQKVRRRACAVT